MHLKRRHPLRCYGVATSLPRRQYGYTPGAENDAVEAIAFFRLFFEVYTLIFRSKTKGNGNTNPSFEADISL